MKLHFLALIKEAVVVQGTFKDYFAFVVIESLL
jgi:hypothetical protein